MQLLHTAISFLRTLWHHSCVNFKRQMSKTLLWRFKIGIDGLCTNVNEGWDKSSVVHRTFADNVKLFTVPIVD